MSYIELNKAAWEEAFSNRDPAWGADIASRVNSEEYPFFEAAMASELRRLDLKGKVVAQFCSNNGRELLSLAKSAKAKKGYGFDIAENQVAFANGLASELGLDCAFRSISILDIGAEYHGQFDAIIVTIGALCWFKDVSAFFSVAAKCLRANGLLIIHEEHPVANMLSAPGEGDFDGAHPAELKNSYFTKEWVGNDGMYYIAKKTYRSKTFVDYTHPFSEIVNGIIGSGLAIRSLAESDADISGSFGHLAGKGFPLSYVLVARKDSSR